MIFALNRKGGSGKTSLVVNLAAPIATDRRVLVLDLDPQGHASTWLGVDDTGEDSVDFLTGVTSPRIRTTEFGVDLIPGGEMLKTCASRLATSSVREAGRQLIALGYDAILVDCPPEISRVVLDTISADPDPVALVPLDGFEALRSVSKLRHVAEDAGVQWRAFHLVLTRYNARQVLDRDLQRQAHDQYGDSVRAQPIRESVAVRESAAFRKPLVQYAPSHPVTIDHLRLSGELSDAS